jgi:hypothetical protein
MKLVENWKALWKAWTVQLAAAGILLPDLLQVIADNSALIPWFDDGYKSGLRLACLVLIVLLRPLKQESLKP